MVVIGEKEAAEGNVAVRRQGKGDLGVQGADAFFEMLQKEIRERRSD
jgi:threonyl-tRNA synthetase